MGRDLKKLYEIILETLTVHIENNVLTHQEK